MRIKGEVVKFPKEIKHAPVSGSAGLRTQLPGTVASVSSLSSATGGIKPSGFVKKDTK